MRFQETLEDLLIGTIEMYRHYGDVNPNMTSKDNTNR